MKPIAAANKTARTPSTNVRTIACSQWCLPAGVPHTAVLRAQVNPDRRRSTRCSRGFCKVGRYGTNVISSRSSGGGLTSETGRAVTQMLAETHNSIACPSDYNALPIGGRRVAYVIDFEADPRTRTEPQ
jgi:hypothetical protein